MKTESKTVKEILDSYWTDAEWPGNPSMNLIASFRMFPNPLNNNRKTKVWVWGKDNENWMFHGSKNDSYRFTVSAGANSSFSYTGSCVECFTQADAIMYVNELYKTKKLFR